MDIMKLCRTCLSKSDDMYRLDEIPSKLVTVKLIDMLSSCISSKVELTNSLPDSVCVPCFQTIRIAYNFIKEYHLCQEKLEKLVDSQKEKKNTDYEHNHKTKVIVLSKKILNQDVKEDVEGSNIITISSFQNEVVIGGESQNETDSGDLTYSVLEDTNENHSQMSDTVSNNKINVSDNCSSTAPVEALCPVCKETTSNLLEHIVQKHKNMFFQCNNCKKTGKYIATQYVQHLKEKHLLYCMECNIQFSSRVTLAHHRRTEHTVKKEYPCDQCKKIFPKQFQVVRHRKEYHSTDPSYFCDECEKAFQTYSAYVQHKKRHYYINANKKYACKFCDRTFQFPFSLSRHITVHSGVDNFICLKCGKGFKTYDSYSYHKRTHDNNRRHMCSFCGLTFLQSVHLKYHIEQKHKNVTYPCEICKKSYTSPSTLAKHKRKFHGNNSI